MFQKIVATLETVQCISQNSEPNESETIDTAILTHIYIAILTHLRYNHFHNILRLFDVYQTFFQQN